MNRYPESFRRAVADAHVAGKSMHVLSRDWNVDRLSIRRWVQEFHPGYKSDGFKAKPFDLEEAKAFEADLALGCTVRQLAATHHVTEPYVAKVLWTLEAVRRYSREGI
jgi:transposase-like protein